MITPDHIPFGYVSGGIIFLILLVLLVRVSDEQYSKNKNYLLIHGGSLAAFALVFRLCDVMEHPYQIRFSSVVGSLGMLLFLAADRTVADRFGRAWGKLTGDTPRYTGPDRRKNPEGQDNAN